MLLVPPRADQRIIHDRTVSTHANANKPMFSHANEHLAMTSILVSVIPFNSVVPCLLSLRTHNGLLSCSRIHFYPVQYICPSLARDRFGGQPKTTGTPKESTWRTTTQKKQTLMILRFWTVTLSVPIRPGIFLPLKTRPGS